MLYIVLAMVLVLVVAGAVVLYAAYPHRGEDVPAVPWLGDAMARAVEAMPTLRAGEARASGHAPSPTSRGEQASGADGDPGRHRVGFTR